MIAQLVGLTLLSAGLLVAMLGVIGIGRMPSFYQKMKPFSLVSTIAALGIHVGTFLITPGTPSYKGLLTALLFLVTGPALAQALMHTAHQLGVPHEASPNELPAVGSETPKSESISR